MNEALNRIGSPGDAAAPVVACTSVAEEDGELMPLAVHLELCSTQGLLTALTTVARLGGRLAFVRAAEAQAVIGFRAPPLSAQRIPRVLAQLVEVLAVSAAAWPPQ
jgi:hypothetical protein